MNELLTQSKPGEPTRFCPDDEALAAYFDAGLENGERQSFERHLADCRWCQGRIGMLSRLEQGEQLAELPAEILAEAKLKGGNSGANRWRRAPAWAAAATVVLITGMLMGQRQIPTAPDSIPTPPTDARQVRSLDREALEPSLIWPTEGAVIDSTAFEIRWSEVAGSLNYELYVLSDSGDLLVHERVDGTTWMAPDSLHLEPGAEYFVRIEARLPTAGTTDSGHTSFVVKGAD